MNTPTNQDFATEVKLDRLNTLWKVTLALCGVALWALVGTAMVNRQDSNIWLLACGALAAGCLLTYFFLRRRQFYRAVWSYTLGALVAITLSLASRNPLAIQIAPFVFPLVVFVIGLLLPPRNTLAVAIAAILAIVFAPAATLGSFEFFGLYQAAAIVLTFMAMLLAAQVIGELYQVTEWALLNYQRERQTGAELFESRELLERSLRRSEALSERLQETNEALEQARAAAEAAKHYRGQFLANMSHELRTPLNAIIGFSETMLRFPDMYDGVSLPNAYEEDLKQIYGSGRQLLNLINDILDLSKVDAGKLEIQMERLDLKPVIHGALATAAGLIGERPIELLMDVPDDLPPVWADDARVRQVLLNLYSNAAKFTERGSITLTVRVVDEGVRLSVTDTGSGIAPEYLDLIFEEFKQAAAGMRRDPRSGAGLGLAISRQLLTLMGGRIWVESQPGRGSTFHFVLQPYREDLVQPQPEVVPSPLDDREFKVIREPLPQEV